MSTAASETCRRKSSNCVASPQVVSKRGAARLRVTPRLPTWRHEAMWCCRMWHHNMASLAHVASGSQLASPDVASKRGVTCTHGVREPAGVARCGVKTWRHLPACRQGATWRRQMWRQSVASLAHMASGSQGAMWRLQMWRLNVASLAYLASGS